MKVASARRSISAASSMSGWSRRSVSSIHQPWTQLCQSKLPKNTGCRTLRRERVRVPDHHVVELVRILPHDVAKGDAGKIAGGVLRSIAVIRRPGSRSGAMLQTNSGIAVPACCRMTPFWLFQLEQGSRDDIEIGGHRSQQRAAKARQHTHCADDRRRSHHIGRISSGMPMAAAMTGKAAKALPMMIVNSAMPTQ